MRKPVLWFLSMSETNQPVQSYRKRIEVESKGTLYCPYNENKGAHQLCSYFFVLTYAESHFFHGAAQMVMVIKSQDSLPSLKMPCFTSRLYFSFISI